MSAPQLPAAAPDIVGSMGSAWRMDLDKLCESAAHRACAVSQWLIFAPYAHPLWHSYALGCITLREVDGFPPAKINLPGATHEVLLFALDPGKPYQTDAHPPVLNPANFCGQFIEPSDEAAAARIEATVRDVIEGRLNPDTDYTQWWIQRFSASNIKGDPATAGETRIVVTDADGNTVESVIPPVPTPQGSH